MKTFYLDFAGYFISKDNLPKGESGIYFVYRGVYNKQSDNVQLNELIYIGKGEDIYARHHPHDRQNDFDSTLQKGEILIYSYTLVDESELSRVECGLIYKRKPRLNSNCTCSFDYPATHFVLSGCCYDFNPTDFILHDYEHC